MVARREFLQRTAVAAGVLGLSFNTNAFGAGVLEQLAAPQGPALPSNDLFARDPEKYWRELHAQWLLAPERINLNCGSVGCTPQPVLRAMIDHILSAETYREAPYPWFGYEENSRLRDLRDSLSAFIGCTRDELALVRNATEANNVVCNGLDMKVGDEVLLTDQEHPGGKCCWEQKAARFGVKLNQVVLPKPPASTEQILDLFTKALTPRTKIIVFSHITTVTGVILPVKEISAMARQRGILTHVDGAHAIGQIPLNMHDLGCDFYASSPHKWLMSPKGTGFLYIREENLEKLWVNIASGEWQNYKQKAYRFSNFGTSNLSVFVGLKAALDFFKEVGPERIYARSHALATRVRDKARSYPGMRICNASTDQFFGSLVSFEPPEGKTLKSAAEECSKRLIRVAGGEQRFRIATHLFTLPSELDTFFKALDAGMKS